MTLIEMSNRHIVMASVGRRITEIMLWLTDYDLKQVEDFDYLGRYRARDVFAFESKNTAMLFKLTFGGE